MAQIFPNQSAQAIVTELVQAICVNKIQSKVNLHKNKVDPFSALIDSMVQKIPLSNWLQKQETARQRQKALQNCIGKFHQDIISSFNDWNNLGTGEILDVVNKKTKIAAEIKNKYNTTKGNHKIQIYRDIEAFLNLKQYKNFTGYYVEIIPSGKGLKTVYNEKFTPTDNTKNGRRAISRDDIRIIDGRSFYEIATGQKDALLQLYTSLPEMIRNVSGISNMKPENEKLFSELFDKAFL